MQKKENEDTAIKDEVAKRYAQYADFRLKTPPPIPSEVEAFKRKL